jgi:hypothetical protein
MWMYDYSEHTPWRTSPLAYRRQMGIAGKRRQALLRTVLVCPRAMSRAGSISPAARFGSGRNVERSRRRKLDGNGGLGALNFPLGSPSKHGFRVEDPLFFRNRGFRAWIAQIDLLIAPRDCVTLSRNHRRQRRQLRLAREGMQPFGRALQVIRRFDAILPTCRALTAR